MKTVAVLAICAAAMLGVPANARADADIGIYIDGAKIESDVAPEMQNDRVMAPIRVISEMSGASISWYEKSRTIEIRLNGVSNSFTVGYSKAARITGDRVEFIDLDAPPYVKNDRVLVPLRLVAEIFGYGVEWDEASRAVSVRTTRTLQKEMTPLGALSADSFYAKSEFGLKDDDELIYKKFEALENDIAEKMSGRSRVAACYVVGQVKSAIFNTLKAENVSLSVDGYFISAIFSKDAATIEIRTKF